MFRVLPSPVFSFTDRLLNWFRDFATDPNEVESPTRRLLVYPVRDGVRMRNLAESKSVTLTISGGQCIIDFTVDGVDLIDKQVMFFHNVHIGQIGETLVEFFKD